MNMKKIRISKWRWIQNRKKQRENNRQMRDKKKKFKKSQSLILLSLSRSSLHYLLNQLNSSILTYLRYPK